MIKANRTLVECMIILLRASNCLFLFNFAVIFLFPLNERGTLSRPAPIKGFQCIPYFFGIEGGAFHLVVEQKRFEANLFCFLPIVHGYIYADTGAFFR